MSRDPFVLSIFYVILLEPILCTWAISRLANIILSIPLMIIICAWNQLQILIEKRRTKIWNTKTFVWLFLWGNTYTRTFRDTFESLFCKIRYAMKTRCLVNEYSIQVCFRLTNYIWTEKIRLSFERGWCANLTFFSVLFEVSAYWCLNLCITETKSWPPWQLCWKCYGKSEISHLWTLTMFRS